MTTTFRPAGSQYFIPNLTGAGGPFVNTLKYDVATGEVDYGAAAAGTTSFPVDNGGPGTPLAGAMSVVSSTTTDFVPCGLETHVGATANELYVENRRFPSAIVVDSSATVGNRGEFTTITAALAAAVAGDTVYVRPGTYTENITMTLGTSLVGLSAAGEGLQVVVGGTINAPPGAGTTIVQNIRGTTGGARGIELQGGAGSNMIFYDCAFGHTGNVLRLVSGNGEFNRCTFTSSGGIAVESITTGGGTAIFRDCQVTGPSNAVSQTIAATLTFEECTVTSTLGDAINGSVGTLNARNCRLISAANFGVEWSSDTIDLEYCFISGHFQTDDATCTFNYCEWGEEINADDAATMQIHHNHITTAVSSGITIGGGAGGSATVTHTTIDTPATPAIFITTGDSLDYAGLSFSNTSKTISGGGTIVSFDSPWIEVTGIAATFDLNRGFIANNAALVTLTLPAICGVGDIFEVCGKGAGGWSIAQLAGQSIVTNGAATTVGVGGSLASAAQFDTVRLLCTTANTTFTVLNSVGALVFT